MGRLIEGGGEGRPAGENLQILDLHKFSKSGIVNILPRIYVGNSQVVYHQEEKPGSKFGALRYTRGDTSPFRKATVR